MSKPKVVSRAVSAARTEPLTKEKGLQRLSRERAMHWARDAACDPWAAVGGQRRRFSRLSRDRCDGALDQANGRFLAGRPVAEDHLVVLVGEQHALQRHPSADEFSHCDPSLTCTLSEIVQHPVGHRNGHLA